MRLDGTEEIPFAGPMYQPAQSEISVPTSAGAMQQSLVRPLSVTAPSTAASASLPSGCFCFSGLDDSDTSVLSWLPGDENSTLSSSRTALISSKISASDCMCFNLFPLLFKGAQLSLLLVNAELPHVQQLGFILTRLLRRAGFVR